MGKRKSTIPVFICSRYAGSTDAEIRDNKELVLKVCRYVALAGGEPLAPHAYYPRFLDDWSTQEREMGIKLGHVWMERCKALFVVDVYGWIRSDGMIADVEEAKRLGLPVFEFWTHTVSQDAITEAMSVLRGGLTG